MGNKKGVALSSFGEPTQLRKQMWTKGNALYKRNAYVHCDTIVSILRAQRYTKFLTLQTFSQNFSNSTLMLLIVRCARFFGADVAGVATVLCFGSILLTFSRIVCQKLLYVCMKRGVAPYSLRENHSYTEQK